MSITRRQLGLGAAAVAPGAAGVGVAWQRLRPTDVSTEAERAFWLSRFDGPNGETVELAAWRGQPVLVNFWATWCPPCVEELPLLNAFYRANAPQGWQVLGLAVDQPSAVRSFLQKLPLDFPVGMAGLAGTELSRSLGNPSGGLPYTIVLGREGTVLHRKIGQVSEADLALWVQIG
jgi:thiol-disulfide isomerase/thioredoxin